MCHIQDLVMRKYYVVTSEIFKYVLIQCDSSFCVKIIIKQILNSDREFIFPVHSKTIYSLYKKIKNKKFIAYIQKYICL